MNERETTPALVRSALSVLDANDRETWFKMASAVKAAIGEAGRDIWWAWSESSPKFDRRAAAGTWKGANTRRVGAGTLFYQARLAGWTPERDLPRSRPGQDLHERNRRRELEREACELQAQARERAQWIVKNARRCEHKYLARKGFPGRRGLVDRHGNLIVPIWNRRREIVSVQMISSAGEKRFLKHGEVGGCFHRIGSRRPLDRFYCEGYSTALSVCRAMALIQPDGIEVVVCFSAGNLVRVAKSGRPGFVIADNDKPDDKGRMAGLDAAKRTGYPYWLPGDLGDANDYHNFRGINSLVRELRHFLLYGRRQTAHNTGEAI